MEESKLQSAVSFMTIPQDEFPGMIRVKSLEEHNLYCIVDCAADETLYPVLKNSDWEYRCLYKQGIHFHAERITDALAATAPYLLKLDPDTMTVEHFIRQRLGKNQAVFFQSDASINDLEKHFSGMLKAMDEKGTVFNFRYHDPRILSVYLPTCTEEEKHIFYGPVDIFWTENEENEVLEFPKIIKEPDQQEVLEKVEEPQEEETFGYGVFGKKSSGTPDSDSVTGYGVMSDI